MAHFSPSRCGAALAAGLLAVPVAGAQPGTERPVLPCVLHADVVPPHPVSALRAHAPRAPAPAASGKQASATFEVTYNGFPQDARAAFQVAVDLWAERVTSSVPIRINANWEPLDEDVLGSAGPFLRRDFGGAPTPGTWYPVALANALAGSDQNGDTPEIEATFNSDFDRWYLGTDGNPPSNHYDLTTVVLHELAHGLGFIGSFTVEADRGFLQDENELNGFPFIYDRFAEDPAGGPLLDYARPSALLADVLENAVFFGGRTVEAADGRPAPLYAPPSWNEGSSYSHYDEQAYPAAGPDGLMTPFIAAEEVIRDPGALTCAALRDIGWTLAPACSTIVPEPPLLPDVFALDPLSGDGDTIVTTAGAAFQLVAEQPQQVRAFLFDLRGRRLATLLDRSVGAGEPVLVEVQAADLAAGLYVVRVVGETFAASRKVVRVR